MIERMVIRPTTDKRCLKAEVKIYNNFMNESTVCVYGNDAMCIHKNFDNESSAELCFKTITEIGKIDFGILIDNGFTWVPICC